MSEIKEKPKKVALSAKNKHFWSLQKRDQRTAIAADIIKQIKEKKIVAKTQTYLRTTSANYFYSKSDTKVDKLLESTQCSCCALGACFAGLVNLGDKVEVGDVFIPNFYEGTGGFYPSINEIIMKNKIREIFTPEQMTLIESCFEVNGQFLDNTISKASIELREEREKAVAFGRKYKNDEDRLVAIMMNIRKNRGTFKP